MIKSQKIEFTDEMKDMNVAFYVVALTKESRDTFVMRKCKFKANSLLLFQFQASIH